MCDSFSGMLFINFLKDWRNVYKRTKGRNTHRPGKLFTSLILKCVFKKYTNKCYVCYLPVEISLEKLSVSDLERIIEFSRCRYLNLYSYFKFFQKFNSLTQNNL